MFLHFEHGVLFWSLASQEGQSGEGKGTIKIMSVMEYLAYENRIKCQRLQLEPRYEQRLQNH